MSDFVQTMKDWRRMCDAHINCSHCPLEHCISPANFKWDEDFYRLERIVDEWADEHPEPKYPTWFGWLEREGILTLETMPCQSNPTQTSTQQSYMAILRGTQKMYKPIPADTAEKLGIEPEEG